MAYTNLMTIIYPVGSIYLSMSNVSPSTLIGGTWSSITNFLYPRPRTTASKTSAAPTHTHNSGTLSVDFDILVNRSWLNMGWSNRAVRGSFTPLNKRAFQISSQGDSTETAWHSIDVHGRTSGSQVIPPYTTCYAWYRTA